MSDNQIETVTGAAGRVVGKRVLVTGAGRGMGRSHAVRLAEEGADLILVDICESLPELEYPLSSRDDLEETARLVEKHDRRSVTHVVDVRDAAALAAAVDDGVDQLGGLDAAVANAGVLTVGTWDTTTSEQWRTVVDVNLIGTWNTCAAALPHRRPWRQPDPHQLVGGPEGHPAAPPLHCVQARCRRVEPCAGQ
jgi:NAD(P)-dependent dehydrogenase (short-subunit alcohol dehydrogenase family)